MKLVRLNPENPTHLRDFIALPFRLHSQHSAWVPPLRREVRRALSPQRHPFYRHSQAAFFLLYEGKDPVGRLAAIDNRHYNDFYKARTGFFYYFDCIDDQQAASRLFSAAFDWLRARGLEAVIGPKGLTPLDGVGLLVRGFTERMPFGLAWNPPYYVQLLEVQGFAPRRDLDSGRLGREAPVPERIHQIADRVRRRRGLEIMRFRTRRDLRALLPHLQSLYNQTLSGVRDNYPLDEAETRVMADQLLWFSDPRLIKAVVKDGQPVGFLLAYPDIADGLRRTGGRLFPTGWATLLRELRRTSWLDLNGAGLIEKYRGLGGTAILFSEMHKTVTEFPRYQQAEVIQIARENEAMQREMRNFGIEFNKTHRVYQRQL